MALVTWLMMVRSSMEVGSRSKDPYLSSSPSRMIMSPSSFSCSSAFWVFRELKTESLVLWTESLPSSRSPVRTSVVVTAMTMDMDRTRMTRMPVNSLVVNLIA